MLCCLSYIITKHQQNHIFIYSCRYIYYPEMRDSFNEIPWQERTVKISNKQGTLSKEEIKQYDDGNGMLDYPVRWNLGPGKCPLCLKICNCRVCMRKFTTDFKKSLPEYSADRRRALQLYSLVCSSPVLDDQLKGELIVVRDSDIKEFKITDYFIAIY